MKRRLSRVFVVSCLLLTQVELLWIPGVHWHEEAWPTPVGAASFSRSKPQGSPADPSTRPCVVCQIVRLNALRPSTGTPTPRPVVFSSLSLPFLENQFSSYHPPVTYGRAPPLS